MYNKALEGRIVIFYKKKWKSIKFINRRKLIVQHILVIDYDNGIIKIIYILMNV